MLCSGDGGPPACVDLGAGRNSILMSDITGREVCVASALCWDTAIHTSSDRRSVGVASECDASPLRNQAFDTKFNDESPPAAWARRRLAGIDLSTVLAVPRSST